MYAFMCLPCQREIIRSWWDSIRVKTKLYFSYYHHVRFLLDKVFYIYFFIFLFVGSLSHSLLIKKQWQQD